MWIPPIGVRRVFIDPLIYVFIVLLSPVLSRWPSSPISSRGDRGGSAG